MSEVGRALSSALDHPADWIIDEHTIKHRTSGLEFWIANGSFFFDGYAYQGTPSCIGLLERHWIFRKVRRLQQLQVYERLKRGAA